jgi:hypothetical protein
MALIGALMVAMSMGAVGQAGAGQKNAPATGIEAVPEKAPDKAATENEQNGPVIEPAELPVTYSQGTYQVNLRVRGDFVPVLQWSIEKGALPPGITLEENGILRGEAQRGGEFQFVVTVRDGGKPQLVVQKAYVIKVVEGITVTWKVPAHVNVNRIEGSVAVTNATVDEVDLTFDVKAVAEDGRATEIGYQRFPLKRGTIGMALPFGENLPHGAYVVYVNVNGEVAKRNVIYKKRLQTKAALQVVVGP